LKKYPVIYKPIDFDSITYFSNLFFLIFAKILREMGEKTRYSDDELKEFKDIILQKLDKARKDYELLKESITHGESNDIQDTSPTFKVLEEGAATLSKEEAGKLAQRQVKFIQHLQAALVRIENKTYGICRATGKLIKPERLRAVPHATLSIDAKQAQ
jgi:DnaK suppressor protein